MQDQVSPQTEGQWRQLLKEAAQRDDCASFQKLLRMSFGEQMTKNAPVRLDLDSEESIYLIMKAMRKKLEEGREWAANLPEGKPLTPLEMEALKYGVAPSVITDPKNIEFARRMRKE